MLEFYYTFHRKLFQKKSEQLAKELLSIFQLEQLALSFTNKPNISLEFQSKLTPELFELLNNIYYTIRLNHGQEHNFLRKYLPESKKMPEGDFLFADFFCGAGGLSQGIVNAGFRPAFVNDRDTNSLETYYFNHNLDISCFSNEDIRDVVNEFEKYIPLFRNIKLVAGGPPCQGFSTANRQNFELSENGKLKRFIEDERNILYKYFVKLLGIIEPDFFIMENVRGMKKFEKQINEDIQQETDHGYYCVPLSLDAQSFNIPQSRDRYFQVGGKNFMMIEQLKTTLQKEKGAKSKFTLSDALFGLPVIGTNPIKLNTEYDSDIHGHTLRKVEVEQNDFLRKINGGRRSSYLFNHKSRYNNDNDLEIFKILPEGENSLHESIQHLSNYTNRNHIFKDKYFKLKRDEVSKTITSHMRYDCHMYIHPEQPRGLSPREAARIQTFPDDYIFRGSLNDWYKQIGNAVPVKLAEVIATELKKQY